MCPWPQVTFQVQSHRQLHPKKCQVVHLICPPWRYPYLQPVLIVQSLPLQPLRHVKTSTDGQLMMIQLDSGADIRVTISVSCQHFGAHTYPSMKVKMESIQLRPAALAEEGIDRSTSVASNQVPCPVLLQRNVSISLTGIGILPTSTLVPRLLQAFVIRCAHFGIKEKM